MTKRPSKSIIPKATCSSEPSPEIPTVNVLDCSHPEPLWLVKVPKYVVSAWQNAPTEHVGSVTMIKTGQGLDDREITMSLGDSTVGTAIPLEYRLFPNPCASQQMAIISRLPEGNDSDLSMDGHISRRAEIRPASSAKKLAVAQIKADLPEKLKVKPVDGLVKGFVPNSGLKRKETGRGSLVRNEKTPRRCRERKEDVLERIFAAFENERYIGINDLVQFTDQPRDYLKEILKEVGDYNASAGHKNMWELKAEYRS